MLITSNVKIVIPKDATLREQFAADELKKYVKMICKVELLVCKDNEPYTEIIAIGGPERNAATAKYISEAEFDKVTPGPEGIFIKSFDNCLVLAGSSKNTNELERGTIYAVYEYLERYLGCSFAAYIKDGVPGGEFVPSLDKIEISDIYYVKAKSDVYYRGACAQYEFQDQSICRDYDLDIAFLDWLAKNRYNHIASWNGVYLHYKKCGKLDECVKRGILFAVGHHDTFDTLLPQEGNELFPEHYYETHPEFYRLEQDGTRFTTKPNYWGQMTLCMRNEQMIDEMIKNLTIFLTDNPNVKMYSIPPKDGTFAQCCCDMCSPYSKIENYLYMITRIANAIYEKFPDVKILVSIYTDLWEPPEYLKELAPNLAFIEAVWHSTGLRKTGKPDGSCLNGTFYEENLLKWKALGASVYYYEYYMGVYPGRQRLVPMADEMQAVYKNIAERGIEGTQTQIEVYNHWNNIFNFYTFGRTAYDTGMSMEDNLARFTRIFGEGAPYVADNIRHAEETLDGQCEIMTSGIYLMNHIDKERMYDGYEKALSAAKTPAARNNIRMMRLAFRYSDIETREDHTKDEIGFKSLKHYDIPERGELLYMKRMFDTYDSLGGYGIMIAVEGEDNGFTPDKWYMFE